jgi:hypothetical protein
VRRQREIGPNCNGGGRGLRDPWGPKLKRDLLNLEYYSHALAGYTSSRRGPKSNPAEDIAFYLFVTILHTRPMPNRSRPLTWSEIQKLLNDAADKEPEQQNREVISYYPRYDGTYFEVITPADRFDAALGIGIPTNQQVHLSISGIRDRVRKGKEIVDLVKQKRKERPDLYPEISVRRIKKRAKIIPAKKIIEVVRANSTTPATIILHRNLQ